MAYKVVLSNSAGVLDVRVVETVDEIRVAVLDLVSGLAYITPGDVIRIEETDE